MEHIKKAGRPIKYNYNEILKPELVRIAKDYQMGILTPTILAENSDIPYWVWRDNKDVKKTLQIINKKRSSISYKTKAIKEIPNLAASIDNIYNDKQKVLAIANDYMYILNELLEYIDALEKELKEISNIKLLNAELMQQLKKSRDNEAFYQEKLDSIMIKSRIRANREILGVQDNLIDIELHKEKAGKIGKQLYDILDELEKNDE